jgi:hypothetical protein
MKTNVKDNLKWSDSAILVNKTELFNLMRCHRKNRCIDTRMYRWSEDFVKTDDDCYESDEIVVSLVLVSAMVNETWL